METSNNSLANVLSNEGDAALIPYLNQTWAGEIFINPINYPNSFIEVRSTLYLPAAPGVTGCMDLPAGTLPLATLEALQSFAASTSGTVPIVDEVYAIDCSVTFG